MPSLIQLTAGRWYLRGDGHPCLPLGRAGTVPETPEEFLRLVRLVYECGRMSRAGYKRALRLPEPTLGLPQPEAVAEPLAPHRMAAMTPQQTIDGYMAWSVAHHSPLSVATRQGVLGRILKGLGNDWSSWAKWNEWINSLDLAKNTKNSYKNALSALLTWAKSQGINIPDPRNGTTNKTTTKIRRNEREREIDKVPFTVEELRKILSTASTTDAIHVAAYISIFTAMNPVDMLAMQWSNLVIREGRYWYVSHRQKTDEVIDIPLALPLVAKLEASGWKSEGPVIEWLHRREHFRKQMSARVIQPSGVTVIQGDVWRRIRRSFATIMEIDVKAGATVTRRLLGHRDGQKEMGALGNYLSAPLTATLQAVDAYAGLLFP